MIERGCYLGLGLESGLERVEKEGSGNRGQGAERHEGERGGGKE